MDIDDGSDKPLGYTTEDGELEVRRGADGAIGYHETELGQHQRWLRQAPELYEKYQDALAALQRMKVKELSRADPRATGEGARDAVGGLPAVPVPPGAPAEESPAVAVSLDPHRLQSELLEALKSEGQKDVWIKMLSDALRNVAIGCCELPEDWEGSVADALDLIQQRLTRDDLELARLRGEATVRPNGED